MGEILAPDFKANVLERQLNCRSAIETAMFKLIAAAKKLGWSEIEITMALADAAEDHVIALAQEARSNH